VGVDSGAYDAVMVLHILCVIVGFGGVMLNGIYGSESKRRKGAEGLAVFEATEKVGRIAEMFIYAVPVFGIALILMSHKQWTFSQAWVSAALAIYVVALTVVLAFHLPNLRRMGVLMRELVVMGPPPSVAGGAVPEEDIDAQAAAKAMGGPPPQVAELERRGKLAGIYGGTLNLAVVAVVILMVWKPGGPH
jgi:uncharacterized membrane protein